MKTLISLLFVVTVLSACASSTLRESSQLEGENFLHELPVGWFQGFSTKKANMEMKEFVPEGQAVDSWDEMITTQIFFGGLGQSIEEFQSSIAQSWKKSCPEAFIGAGKSGTENGYKFAFWQQFCQKNPNTGLPELTLFKAIEGNDGFYLIQKSWRRMPTEREVVSGAKFMKKAYVCDSRISDQACPSSLN